MSGPIGTSQLMYSAAPGDFYTHQIASSTRFNGTGYLNDARSGDGSNSHGTISCWFKRAKLGTYQYIFSAHEDGNNAVRLTILADNTLEFRGETGSAVKFEIETTNVFRDTSAWYHFVGIIDMDNSTQANRAQVYINGERQTVLDTSTMPSDASQTMVLNTGGNLRIGAASDASYDFHGCITEFVVIDGTAQAVGDFGETKNGVWIPKDPSGLTFGTNGVYLKMADSSSLGTDSSGNGHTFGLTNIDADDHTLDSPTFGSSSSGNFPLWSPLIKDAVNLSEGNTRFDGTTTTRTAMTTWGIPTGTKYYVECLVTMASGYGITFGLANPDIDMTAYNESDSSMNGFLFVGYSGSEWRTNALENGSRQGWSGNVGLTSARVMAITIDRVANQVKCYLNNSLITGGTVAISATQEYHIVCSKSSGAHAAVHMNINAGHDSTGAGDFSAGSETDENGFGSFHYAPPSGFLALCSGNLPVADAVDPAQTDVNFPKKLFSAHLYAGAQVTNAVSGLGFQPDFINIKSRTAGTTNPLYDSSRGNTKLLSTVSTDGDTTQADTPGLSAFGTDGFTVVYPNTGDYYNNRNSNNYVAWCQRANGGTVSTNDEGSIDSSVQVDPSGCFSIATWTGTGSNATIGHGLGAKPSYILVKNRAEHAWAVYYGDNTDYLVLNTTAATVDDATYWQDTAPTTDVFSIGTEDGVNASSGTYIAYCYANCEGFIKSGTYEGNGNADGTFVYTGFSPAFIMTKSLDSTSNWQMFDNKRLGYNVDNNAASANLTDAPVTTDMIDILSNGFKCRIASDPNVAETYIYLAIAENPLKYATAR